jgi:ribosomal-protein-alanine N-acetyltransferase
MIIVEPHLEGPRVVVRMARPDDAHAVARFYRENEEHLRPWMASADLAERSDDAWWSDAIARQRAEFRAGTSCKTLVFDRNDGSTVVGTAGLSQIFRGRFHACYLGYNVDGRRQGQGLMYEAVRLLIDYAFDELHLHRIMAGHHPANERSARLLARLGFVREGLAKEYLLMDRGWEDSVLTALTNPRWTPPPEE